MSLIDREIQKWNTERVLHQEYIKNPNKFVTDIIGIDNVILSFKGERFFKELAPYQTYFITTLFANPKMDAFMLAARAAAKTWTTALYLTMRAWDDPSLNMAIVSGSLQQAGYCYDYMNAFLQSPKLDCIVDKINTQGVKFCNGGETIISPASEKFIRGFRAQILVNDEICMMSDELIFAALGCLQGAEGEFTPMQRIIAGTPDNPNHSACALWKKQFLLPPEKRSFLLIRVPMRPVFPGDWSIPWIPDTQYNRRLRELKEGTVSKSEFDVFVNAIWAQLQKPVYQRETLENATVDGAFDPKKNHPLKGCISIDVGVEHPTVACFSFICNDGHHVISYLALTGDDYDTIIESIYEKIDIIYPKSLHKYILIEAHFGSSFFMRLMRDYCANRHDINILPVSFSHQKDEKIMLLKAMMVHGYFHLHLKNSFDPMDYSVQQAIDSIAALQRTVNTVGQLGTIIKKNDDMHDATVFQVYISNEFFPMNVTNTTDIKNLELARMHEIETVYSFYARDESKPKQKDSMHPEQNRNDDDDFFKRDAETDDFWLKTFDDATGE